MSDDFIGIGAAARRFGLAESALRYWEKRGLLHPAQRRSSWRLYGPEQLHRIGLIKMWRESGLMSLDEIEAVLTAGGRDWRDAVRDRLGEIEHQQDRLAKAKVHLEHLLTCPDANPAEDRPYLRTMTAELPSA
ncbi:MerR family transcriptional regulator [Mycolicibacterium peregrinum]|uniref:MerR family transcriptional regulator n=1 Tax=Mycolicibacterium peregrinum TaxID=43304 RepID=A0A1A0WAD2_MYCPR|nr:MerR family transcriptional regulator [Mycolicibacterium peregrinum]OBB93637.1 MerR family transcriptional regulator [Mycolicibacterium peregrinum]